ncbi:probable E3 ubiquitin-protein ligase RNF144A-A [Harmonia axyridis]|uniref:probable E3 ubiquitin-protein ligase RNF144A-A n=1 Tax=Harmonia axyridis TaxID=115357 RepID=UPI001E27783C|nr:probable E3 ubiquitin-protein ligase RNF144A-A [Harmonia axyridis]XP_045462914.1 probable E3 ubiquitin-protein ligase RNF144A-A [Harmonia axyridis]XP_045462915.1 probable E3 ubiquitin-protein ligase RNF144A-A [Harmonia axyridis]
MTFSNLSTSGDSASPPLRRSGAGKHQQRVCLSAVWAEPQTNRRERRRAIYSWSFGYGTLTELGEIVGSKQEYICKKGKVADNTQTLEQRGRRLVTSIPLPHVSPSSPPRSCSKVDFKAMPGIKSFVGAAAKDRSPAEIETSLPLVKRDEHPRGEIIKQCRSLANLRRCDTLLALTGVLKSSSSTSSVEPLHPVNRLRPPSVGGSNCRLCSRCSSLLTLASSSKYSLNSCAGFVPVKDEPNLLCKLCLAEVPSKDVYMIKQCNCSFCLECMTAYVKYEIAEGAYDISCPDARCPEQGILQQDEIKRLVGEEQFEKHKKYRLNREIEVDQSRTWCPRAGCETVCTLCPSQPCLPQSVLCPTCTNNFCSNCKLEWHEGITCDQYSKQLAREGKAEEPGIPFDSDLIKCCPMCNVPIEKDEGCAQMMCKRCKHVFCWYCLASLDDDFLLRHYDKGPCKNKLGHSRASVMWHRTQVIGIFAGFGILLLVASPLLLLAAPCIICCKCRICNAGNTKMDNEESSSSERL